MDSVSPHIYYYIPSRFQEGYGLNENVIRELSDSGFNLIITVDCGIVSFREVALAKELGMEVIVTDHHAVGENIPSCIVLNPHQKDYSYQLATTGCTWHSNIKTVLSSCYLNYIGKQLFFLSIHLFTCG